MSVDTDIGELFDRVRALEANPGLPTIEDEGIALPQRSIYDFVGTGVTATDDAPDDKTIITIPGATATVYTDFTPVLDARPGSGTDPVLGAGDSILSRYTRVGMLVHWYGQGTFGGAGFDHGTGIWRLTMPIDPSVDGLPASPRPNGPVGNAYILSGDALSMGAMEAVLYQDGVHDHWIQFLFSATAPFGAAAYFQNGTGYTWAPPGFTNILQWDIVYEARVAP